MESYQVVLHIPTMSLPDKGNGMRLRSEVLFKGSRLQLQDEAMRNLGAAICLTFGVPFKAFSELT